MASDFPLSTLLTGVAKGSGSAAMMLELLAILHDKGVLTEEDVQRVVAVMAAEMRDFDLQMRESVSARTANAATFKG